MSQMNTSKLNETDDTVAGQEEQLKDSNEKKPEDNGSSLYSSIQASIWPSPATQNSSSSNTANPLSTVQKTEEANASAAHAKVHDDAEAAGSDVARQSKPSEARSRSKERKLRGSMKYAEFVKDNNLNKGINTVPGIGSCFAYALQERGILTAKQLYGLYKKANRDEESFLHKIYDLILEENSYLLPNCKVAFYALQEWERQHLKAEDKSAKTN